MARKKKTRRSRSFSVPIALVVGGTAGVFIKPATSSASPLTNAMNGRFDRMINGLGKNYMFFNTDTGKLDAREGKGLIALLVGAVVHKIASKLGVNRMLGRAGVPIIRI